MNRRIYTAALFVLLGLWVACSSSNRPSNEQISQLVETESILSRSDFGVDTVIVHTGTVVDEKNYKARLTIRFHSNQGGMWGNEGKRDPIPNFSRVNRGSNSIDATAIFSKYDDGKWHLEGFEH